MRNTGTWLRTLKLTGQSRDLARQHFIPSFNCRIRWEIVRKRSARLLDSGRRGESAVVSGYRVENEHPPPGEKLSLVSLACATHAQFYCDDGYHHR
jgi:hypothetical protein